MEKVAPNSKFVVHSNEIIWQSKIKGPFKHLDSLPNFHTYLKKKVYVYFLSIVKAERLFTSLSDTHGDRKPRMTRPNIFRKL